jgi:hypothetical protein
MFTTLRRMFWLALLGGAGYAGIAAWRRREGDSTGAAPEWPPLDPPPPSATDAVAAAVPSAGAPPAATAAGFTDGSVPHTSNPTGSTTSPSTTSPSTTSPTWVEPIDGACPDGYPIKANDNSGIFHVPGGRFYERTRPERCYADAHDAEADGYRRAKA